MLNTNQIDFVMLRKDFPMLNKTMHGKPLVYFDSAATAHKPQVVIDTITDFYTNHYGTVHRAVYELSVAATEEYQHVRCQVATFLNANKPEEIIFTRGTTESINLIAYSFGKAFIKPGDEILITEMEHHSNIVPWQIACEDRGCILKVVPITDAGEIDLVEFAGLLTKKTKLVAVTHVSNALGTVNLIKEIAALAHNAGAKILVDGAQAAPWMAVDVQDLDVDFYVFSGHKIYGPTGIGILYGKEALLQAMPPYQGGGDMILSVNFDKTIYSDVPMKFEAGTPMIAEVLGLGAAISYLNQIGMENIRYHETHLLQYMTKRLQEIDQLRIIGTAKKKGPIISFEINGLHPLDLGTMLDLRGFALRTGHHCAQPVIRHFNLPGTIRASFGLYNNTQEVDSFIDNLQEIVKLIK